MSSQTSIQSRIQKLIAAIQTTFLGKTDAVELAVCTFLSGGHLLIEDVPGVGKTTLAKAMAEAFGGTFNRIQFTSDMLPADIIGISVWNDQVRQFEFKSGPIFANLVLADEINRASPKTQSALLEAMSERQISQEGISHLLEPPFMVIATQNVQDSYGTYPLPESQLDRFTMRIRLGYTAPSVEKEIIRNGLRNAANRPAPALTKDELAHMLQDIEQTKVEESVMNYMMEIIEKTRQSDIISIGISPRGGINLFNCAKAYAQLKGRDFVLADDIQILAIPVLAHRLIFHDDAGFGVTNSSHVETTLRKIVHSVPVPV